MMRLCEDLKICIFEGCNFRMCGNKLLELKWLEDFLAVAGSGNFSRAAETRNVTQPAFSRRLKALEMWIGVPLLDRSSYPITLTPAGAKFLPIAEAAVRDLHNGRLQVRAVSTADETTLRFAMPHSLAVGFFPTWWQQVDQAKSGITAKVIADNFHDCVEMLLHGACHILLCYTHDAVPNPLSASGCPGMAVDHDRLVAVSVPDMHGKPLHRLDANTSNPVAFLNYAPDAFLGKVVASLLNKAPSRLNLDLRYESAFAEAVRAQTLVGAGMAWLPRSLISNDLQDGRLVMAGDPLPQADLEIWLYRSTQNSSRTVEKLWQSAKLLSERTPRDAGVT
jgi:LysR family transcriptional regulator, hypochlorite-specific transcription factor HypT